MPLRVVFDTNVLFSALGWRGPSFACIELARAGKLISFTCAHILDELAEKLESKLAWTPEQVQLAIADVLIWSQPVRTHGSL